MNYDAASVAEPWIIPAVILLSPIAFTLWCRHSALSQTAAAEAAWLGSRRIARGVRLVVVAVWWAAWDLQDVDFFISPYRLLLFLILPIFSIGVSQWIACSAARLILRLKWNFSDIVRLTFWSTVSSVAARIGIATGAEAIYRGWWRGVFLLAASGIVALVGSNRLRSSEGLHLRPLRAGRLHGRAFQLAKKMSVRLRRVYIVPAGKGHLTNAFGMPGGIALTDNYGEFATGPQLDFVIGHELIHVKRRHGLKQVGFALVLYALFAVLIFALPPSVERLRPIIDLLFLLLPTLTLYFISRTSEYSADREAIEFTADPEAAIQALANLYRMAGTPTEYGRTAELFQTHPAFSRRVAAIASRGGVPSGRVQNILALLAQRNL